MFWNEYQIFAIFSFWDIMVDFVLKIPSELGTWTTVSSTAWESDLETFLIWFPIPDNQMAMEIQSKGCRAWGRSPLNIYSFLLQFWQHFFLHMFLIEEITICQKKCGQFSFLLENHLKRMHNFFGHWWEGGVGISLTRNNPRLFLKKIKVRKIFKGKKCP